MRRYVTAAAGIVAAIILVVVLTSLFIPDRTLEGIVARGMESQGFTFTARRFGKAFPVGIKAAGVDIGTSNGTILKVDAGTVRLNLFPLLAGKVNLSYRLKIGAGEVNGTLSVRGGGTTTITARGVRLEDIPFFATVTGAEVKGELGARGQLTRKQAAAAGELQVEVTRADLRGIKIGETPLPDAGYDSVRGAFKIGGGKITLESFTLQGEGLYVRLKGDLPFSSPLSSAPLNLTLEMMPKPDFLERQKFVFLLLTKYQSSPGHFEIPIRGTLAKPSLP